MPEYNSNDAAIFNASMQTINNAANIASTNRMNRKTREFNEKIMDKQRAWAIEDWHMQNQYNKPSEQMARLREAGLNPHLVYGKGADNTASAVRSSDSAEWNPDTPKFDMGSPFADMYDFSMKQAQIDNLAVQNTVAQQRAALDTALAAATIKKTDSDISVQDTQKNKTYEEIQSIQKANKLKDIEISGASDLLKYSLDSARANLRKLNADTDYTLHQDERAAASNAATLKESAERVLNLRSQRATDAKQRESIEEQIKGLKNNQELQRLEIELKRMGVQPTDGFWWRVLGRFLNEKQANPNAPTLRQSLEKSQQGIYYR